MAGGGWKRTGGICASGISHDDHRLDTPLTGKRHNQERETMVERRLEGRRDRMEKEESHIQRQ